MNLSETLQDSRTRCERGKFLVLCYEIYEVKCNMGHMRQKSRIMKLKLKKCANT